VVGKRSHSLNADLAAEETKNVIFGQNQVGANYQERSLHEHGCQQRDPVMAGSDALKQTRAVVRFGSAIASTHNMGIRPARLETQTDAYGFVQFLYRKPGHR
jgi:hypothetical protein